MSRSPASRPSTIILSVLADVPQRHAASLEARRGLEQAAAWLGQQLESLRFSSTWFCVDPAAMASRELAPVARKHAMGLLTETAWSSPKTSRAKLASELTRRLLAARSQGIEITTLAMPGAEVPHADLIHRHGILALANFTPGDTRIAAGNVRSPFFGLWQIPIETLLPHSGLRRLRMAARGWLRAGAGKGVILHAGIDLAQLWQGGTSSQRSLRRWLAAASRLCDGQQCQVSSLEEAADALAPKRQSPSSRSILKVA